MGCIPSSYSAPAPGLRDAGVGDPRIANDKIDSERKARKTRRRRRGNAGAFAAMGGAAAARRMLGLVGMVFDMC
ncbi:hypothetical protein LTR78_003744 [Recurvomyces mirabilis]|uniref:Uncharacterized protein n=1 Tax=Recurvomyces mirabilis TaxID=574656 RepID=A0AAE1C3J6_9PEZI|nr:hypothetical protein LTR78_003744 [Recurvomyces mirabilis]KAK5154856.1 hypothetical protein LTS14_006437 [Recurvomyces mirabilis]